MDLLKMLSDRLIARASDLQLQFQERPSALHETRMRSAGFVGIDDDAAPDASLPQEAESYIIGHHAILLGKLEGSLVDAEKQWNRFLNQAAIARSWLPANVSEDLNLFFVGPSDGNALESWRELAAEIERDDRVCRKLVWLPPASTGELESSLNRFLSRTFLARPWSEAGAPGEHEIDRLRNLGSKLESDAATHSTVEEWLKILRASQGDSNDLVQQLTEAIP